MSTRRDGKLWFAAIVAGLLVVILVGSTIYWFADGSVGTPQQFKTRVADTGLDVDWSNAGPRSGDGTVTTDCGEAQVTVNDIDGTLWLTAAGNRQLLSATVIRELVSCQP